MSNVRYDEDQENDLNSSADSEIGIKDPDQNTVTFYMVDDDENIHVNDHQALIQKTVLLEKLHRRKEYKIQQSSIGWNLLFEIFFSKFFLIKFTPGIRKKLILNLREIEFRIRKEIGKRPYNSQQVYKNQKDFFILNKYDAKPPVSTWYEYNILKENLIDEKEKYNYVPDIVNTILSIEPHSKSKPKIRRVTTALSEKKRKKPSNQAISTKKKSITIDLTKFTSNESEGQMSLLLTSIENKEKKKDQQGQLYITKKEKLPYGLSKKSPHILKLFAFPKSVFNLLKKFEMKFVEKGYTLQEAEEELTNIQNDHKTYEIEMRKNKIYMDNSLKDQKYLFDFRHLNKLFEKQKNQKEQPCNFMMKSKLEQMMNDIDNVVSYELKKTK